MGLFDKLFADKNVESALNKMKEAAQELKDAADKRQFEKPAQHTAQPRPAAQQSAPAPAPAPVYSDGDSFYDNIPAEENQYNFNGTYIQYFEKIFREDFGAYTFTSAPGSNSFSPIYTFFRDGAKVLIGELKSESSEAQRFRRAAEAEGVPYLRFYYDHSGWWNTRKYVTERIGKVLR